MNAQFWNEDCIKGAGKIADNSVDLLICDPPFGIEGGTLDKHYNRDGSMVIDGYHEVSIEDYPTFTYDWIRQAKRVLRPGGTLYIVSGYNNLERVLCGARYNDLNPVNHIIWKYNFGVWTTRKFVTSHYHILMYEKPGGKRTFNAESRFPLKERDVEGNPNYRDREDVWIIPREYKTGEQRVQNTLPRELVRKMMQYSSNRGDLVGDFFLGGFTTAIVAKSLERSVVGFEISRPVFERGIAEFERA